MTQTLKELLYIKKLKLRIIKSVSETLKLMDMPFLINYVTPRVNSYSTDKLFKFEQILKNFSSDDKI